MGWVFRIVLYLALWKVHASVSRVSKVSPRIRVELRRLVGTAAWARSRLPSAHAAIPENFTLQPSTVPVGDTGNNRGSTSDSQRSHKVATVCVNGDGSWVNEDDGVAAMLAPKRRKLMLPPRTGWSAMTAASPRNQPTLDLGETPARPGASRRPRPHTSRTGVGCRAGAAFQSSEAANADAKADSHKRKAHSQFLRCV
jgi:hypothetical protein